MILVYLGCSSLLCKLNLLTIQPPPKSVWHLHDFLMSNLCRFDSLQFPGNVSIFQCSFYYMLCLAIRLLAIGSDEEPCWFLFSFSGSPILLSVMLRAAMFLSLSIPFYSGQPAKRSYPEVTTTDIGANNFSMKTCIVVIPCFS